MFWILLFLALFDDSFGSTCNPSVGCVATSSCTNRTGYCQSVSLASCEIDYATNPVQGYRGWHYGYNLGSGFIQYGIFDPSVGSYGAWARGNTYPNNITLWSNCRGHPDTYGASVMRFISPDLLSINISGYFANIDTSCGDGVIAKIVQDGTLLWNGYDNSNIPQFFSLSASLNVGAVLDFEAWPNANPYCDSFIFVVNITGPCWSPFCNNIVCNYSETPCNCAPSWTGTQCTEHQTSIVPANDTQISDVCVSLLVDGVRENLCNSTDQGLQYYYFGRVSEMSLVNSTTAVSFNSSISAISFAYRVFDSFDQNQLQPEPPTWTTVPVQTSVLSPSMQITSTTSLNADLTAELSTPQALDSATEGRVRTLQIQWTVSSPSGLLVVSYNLYFIQVSPQQLMTQAQTQMFLAAKVIVIGAGFAGLSAAKAMIGGVKTPSDLLVLEKDQILSGYDDIMLSRAIADVTSSWITDNSFPLTSETREQLHLKLLATLQVVSDDMTEKRQLVRQDLDLNGIFVIENVNTTWMEAQLLSYPGIIIDARCGFRSTTYRDTIIRLLLDVQNFNESDFVQLNMYGYGYAAHTLLSTLVLLGFKTNIYTSGPTIKNTTYPEPLANATVNTVMQYWEQMDHIRTFPNQSYDVSKEYTHAYNLILIGRLPSLPLAAPHAEIIRATINGTNPTADDAIISCLIQLRAKSAMLKRVLTTSPASTIQLMDVDEYRESKSTASDPPYGIVQFYGIPTVGWDGYYSTDRYQFTASVNLRDYYPPTELEIFSLFLVGQSSETFDWKIVTFMNASQIVGITGNFYAPYILDLFRPFLFVPAADVREFVDTFASNRGNWQTDLVRGLLQKSLATIPDSSSSVNTVETKWIVLMMIHLLLLL